MPEVCLRIQRPHVIREQFDGEVVIVNLNSGIYYSLDNVGAVVWTALEQGPSAEAVVRSVLARYAGDPEEIDREIQQFLARLQQEDLIVEGPTRAETESPATAPDGEKPPFVPPTLNKYNDMQDLLLLDPIHEVDEAGWPTAKAEATVG